MPAILVVSLSCACVHATDLGALGPTYPIAEPHLLDVIRQRLMDLQRSGQMQRLIQDAQEKAVATVQRPPAVEGLQVTQVPRTWFVDPSFTLQRNLLDARGHLLFPAGTRKNPLEVVSLSQRLLFFDARDRRQIAAARTLMARHAGQVKPILTGGSYLELMRTWRTPVYFDQHGNLTRRFGIQQVPAIVSQEGLRLRVDEVLLQ